ncbi:MAG TPA: aminotransferase class I/II-fold pyridoxal phosphate-dependent enzyme, partial [Chroococcales cyanobacterium]
MLLDKESLALLRPALETLEQGFKDLPGLKAPASADIERMGVVLQEVAERMKDNFPYPHPFYAGQMLKPPHAMARLAYMLSMWINPNNHALDGGRASSAMEVEAVAAIASMFGWQAHLGHLTGGGTMANLEALWVASKIMPDGVILASEHAHYTHHRLCEVLKIPFRPVPADSNGRMDMSALKGILQETKVAAVVATMGSTAIGSVDPLAEMLELQKQHKFRIHADAAYGGYFVLAENLSRRARTNFDLLSEVDSIVVDPHKHGLQPYGCGCIIFKDRSVGHFYKHDSPYTYFSSNELHLGEISLECSRPGSSAVALWATQRLLPLTRDGEFAADLAKCRSAALRFHELLSKDPRFVVPLEPELDIVVYAVKGASASQSSQLAREIFDRAAENG